MDPRKAVDDVVGEHVLWSAEAVRAVSAPGLGIGLFEGFDSGNIASL